MARRSPVQIHLPGRRPVTYGWPPTLSRAGAWSAGLEPAPGLHHKTMRHAALLTLTHNPWREGGRFLYKSNACHVPPMRRGCGGSGGLGRHCPPCPPCLTCLGSGGPTRPIPPVSRWSIPPVFSSRCSNGCRPRCALRRPLSAGHTLLGCSSWPISSDARRALRSLTCARRGNHRCLWSAAHPHASVVTLRLSFCTATARPARQNPAGARQDIALASALYLPTVSSG